MNATKADYAERCRRRTAAQRPRRENPLQRRLCTMSARPPIKRPLSHLVQWSQRIYVDPVTTFRIGLGIERVFARWILKGSRRT